MVVIHRFLSPCFQRVVVIDIGSSAIRAGVLGERRKSLFPSALQAADNDPVVCVCTEECPRPRPKHPHTTFLSLLSDKECIKSLAML